MTYNQYGQLLAHADFKGQTTAYVYDNTATGQGQETGEYRYSAGTTALNSDGSVKIAAAAESTRYTYDQQGRQHLLAGRKNPLHLRPGDRQPHRNQNRCSDQRSAGV